MASEFVVIYPWETTFALTEDEIAEDSFTPDTVASDSSVSAATNANPIRITTSAAHGLRTGMHVRVYGVGGNTAANGVWRISVVSSTQFDLVLSVGNGTYTSGGTVTAPETAEGATIVLGMIVMEKDMLAINAAVIPPLPGESATGKSRFMRFG